MIREDIVFSGTIGNLRIGRNVRIAGNFGFCDSAIVPVDRVIPKINRADMPVFDLPSAGGKGKEYVWVGSDDGYLLRVDMESEAVRKISIGGKLQQVAVDGRFAYALDFDAGILSRVSKNSLTVTSINIPTSGKNCALGVDKQYVWYSTADHSAVYGTEFYTYRVSKAAWNNSLASFNEIKYGFPTALFVDKDYVWVTNTIYLKPLEGTQGQAGGTSTPSAIVFNHPEASNVNDFYNGQDLWVYYGGWTGASEKRTIVDYDGATKTVYVNPPYDDVGGFFANPAYWVWYRVRKYDMGRINKSNLTVTSILVMEYLTDVVADANYVWACVPGASRVLRISKADYSITTIDMNNPYGYEPLTLASDRTYLWVVDNKYGSPGVIRINKSNLSFQKINITETNFRSYGISLDSKYVWVTEEDGNRLVRITKSSFEQKSFSLPSVTKCRGNMTDYAYRALIAL
ncbi:MAG: hypothetical protein HYW14_04140 [Planctomycetes bacterium]|nr:hypothetical protein [Planctomycetota bacterium]